MEIFGSSRGLFCAIASIDVGASSDEKSPIRNESGFPITSFGVRVRIASLYIEIADLLGGGVLLENAGVDEFVDELLHAVEHGEEALGRHDDSLGRFRFRRVAVGSGLECDKVKTNHVAGKVNLADAVGIDFFLH